MTAWQMSLKISGDRMVKAIEKRTKQLQEERALEQALLNNPELQRQHAEQEKQKEVQAVERQAKQIAQQSEQLTKRIAEQIAEVNKQLASIPGGKPITKVDKVTAENETTKPKLSDDDQYKTTIVTKMVALIKQRKII